VRWLCFVIEEIESSAFSGEERELKNTTKAAKIGEKSKSTNTIADTLSS
jgi:hypothetical protein